MTGRRDDIDSLRGAVMVLMALDHVRDFVSGTACGPTDLSCTTPALFLTRWVTHYCAPIFVCLAGVSARLLGERGRPRQAVSWFLLTRGLWLVVLELTVVRMGWFFQWWGPVFVGQVIWAIGWSMVVLAGLVWLPVPMVAGVAVTLIAGHNLLDHVAAPVGGIAGVAWAVLHTGTPVPLPTGMFIPAYPLIPWPGVMALGYVIGGWLARDRGEVVARAGLVALAGFVVLRSLGVYGDPRPWIASPGMVRSAMSFLNTTKYPPSLLYLLMTLGPAFAALPLMRRLPVVMHSGFVTFGRVPLFYYVLHLYLIHLVAIAIAAVAGYSASEWLAQTVPFGRPAGSGYALPVVYAVWGGVVALLYPPCRWFAGVKARQSSWWLSYL